VLLVSSRECVSGCPPNGLPFSRAAVSRWRCDYSRYPHAKSLRSCSPQSGVGCNMLLCGLVICRQTLRKLNLAASSSVQSSRSRCEAELPGRRFRLVRIHRWYRILVTIDCSPTANSSKVTPLNSRSCAALLVIIGISNLQYCSLLLQKGQVSR
jgi:hypothetical protein